MVLSQFERGEIIGLFKLGYTSYVIAKALKMSETTVYRIVE